MSNPLTLRPSLSLQILLRLPSSPLFPYTTLFRSLFSLRTSARVTQSRLEFQSLKRAAASSARKRSEDHPSKLQSRLHLVRRVLFEKKLSLTSHGRKRRSSPVAQGDVVFYHPPPSV